jgi:hypothetical protein
VTLRGKDRTARIGGRGDGAARGPGFEIVDGIDDAAAELAIGRAGAVGPMLFEGAGGQAEKLGGFLGAQEARRENGEVGSHGWGLRELREGR